MKMKILLIAALTAVAALVVAWPAAAHDQNSCPAGDHNGNLEIWGPCTITGHQDGDIKIHNGTLTVAAKGSVNGNIEQFGRGWVVVYGTVDDNIKEFGPGGVWVSGRYASVNGNIEEGGRELGCTAMGRGPWRNKVCDSGGGVTVQWWASVNGNITEKHHGNVAVLYGARVNDNIKEEGWGHIFVRFAGGDALAFVNGNLEEKDRGSIWVGPGARVEGNAKAEDGFPFFCNIAPSAVTGNLEGDCND